MGWKVQCTRITLSFVQKQSVVMSVRPPPALSQIHTDSQYAFYTYTCPCGSLFIRNLISDTLDTKYTTAETFLAARRRELQCHRVQVAGHGRIEQRTRRTGIPGSSSYSAKSCSAKCRATVTEMIDRLLYCICPGHLTRKCGQPQLHEARKTYPWFSKSITTNILYTP